MLDSYRRVLSRPGALRFSAAALVARLPVSMVSLGIVLLVEGETGSYGLAGTVSATYVLAEAAMALLHGRWLDAHGQSRVLPLAISVFGAALALMVLAVEQSWPVAATYVFAAIAGGSLPQVGASVRARWSNLLSDTQEVQTAYALESVLDEVVFMVGPVAVTVLATLWHPVAGLAVAVVTGVAGTFAYAAQRDTEPTPHGRRAAAERPAMPWGVVAPLAVVSLALGTLFGVAEVATVAFADERNHPAAAGVLLAAWALGSLVGGLVTGVVAWQRGPAVRVRVGIVVMTLSMVPLALVDSVPLMAVLLLVSGGAVAPTLIATLSMVERSVPPGRLTEGLAVLHTGLVAGVAPGASAAGFVIDHQGASPAYLVAVAAGLVGAVAAQWTRRSEDRSGAKH
ncbi:MFS transporter [Nocardioides houyundeii]|uniref:MFS transporter n=1 Tax=Nocardioides houyundeii TaxID=2045452 RepID=UPI000C7900D6|nr:MFS transporter [Nocardioides houyundeii]